MADLALDIHPTLPSRWIAGIKRGGARLWIGAALVGALVLVALLAPLIAPHDPIEQDLMSAQLPPAWLTGGDPSYWLGTDSLGRCVLSRLIYSARTAVAGRHARNRNVDRLSHLIPDPGPFRPWSGVPPARAPMWAL